MAKSRASFCNQPLQVTSDTSPTFDRVVGCGAGSLSFFGNHGTILLLRGSQSVSGSIHFLFGIFEAMPFLLESFFAIGKARMLGPNEALGMWSWLKPWGENPSFTGTNSKDPSVLRCQKWAKSGRPSNLVPTCSGKLPFVGWERLWFYQIQWSF